MPYNCDNIKFVINYQNPTSRGPGLCVSNNANKCDHTSADYGPCISNPLFKHENCKYRTFTRDYIINNKGRREEEVLIDPDAMNSYHYEYSQWPYIENLRNELRKWRPCEYYHQLNIALASSHAILNYSLFLALSFATYEGIPSRELLVLDEVPPSTFLRTALTSLRVQQILQRHSPSLKVRLHT